MDLSLYIVLIVISLIFIFLGFYKSEHTEFSLIGFMFLFLLSMVMLQGNIQYKTGVFYNYSCLCCGEFTDQRGTVYGAHVCDSTENSSLYVSSISDVYGDFTAGGVLSHLIGYYLAVASSIGFAVVLISLRRTKNFND